MFLAFAVALFAGLHLIAAVPPLKAGLQQRLGKVYGPAFGIGSLVSLVLVVLAWQSADRPAVYDPPDWGFRAALALNFVACLFLGLFIFRGRMRQIVRFPLAIAVMLWATAHLIANGDGASVILFGGFLLYGVSHLLLGLANGVRPAPEVRQGHDAMSLLSGVALYGVLIQLHAHLFGIALFSIDDLSILAR